jgi:3-isopropylmalate dehydrogenase
MVLRHSANLDQDAAAIETAVAEVLTAGHRTADIARRGNASADAPTQHLVSTTEMGKLVHEALAQSLDRRQSMHAV